jgi:hypothetical protein
VCVCLVRPVALPPRLCRPGSSPTPYAFAAWIEPRIHLMSRLYLHRYVAELSATPKEAVVSAARKDE